MTRNTKPPVPAMDVRLTRGKTRPFALHDHNPPGTKLADRAAQKLLGVRR